MRKNIIAVLLVVFFGLYTTGCALLVGAAVGAGGVTWVKGKLVKVINEPYGEVHTATIEGLKALDLPIITDRQDQLVAKVESKFADGTNVWIDVKKQTEYSTQIQIRVGVLGDQERSQKILSAVEDQLK